MKEEKKQELQECLTGIQAYAIFLSKSIDLIGGRKSCEDYVCERILQETQKAQDLL